MNYSLSALYVGDLHPEVTESMLVEEFSSAGHVHSVRVCRKWNNDVSLNYAFVNFYKQADAERALATLNFKLLMGWPMRVMWSRRDSTLRKSGVGNLFIRNLDMTTIDSMTLFDLFSVFGNVLSCKVVAYKTGTKGYGYVQFESPEAANVAKERLDGKLFNDHKVSIEHFKSCKERKAEGNYHTQFHLQPAPAQAPDVVEKPAPAKVPAVEEKQAQVPAVEKKTAQAPAVEKKTAQAPAVEKKPAPAKAPAVEEKPGQVPAVEEKPASFQVQTLTEVPSASDVPMAPPPQKRLTIYMLESADFEMQIQMAHDHLLPLVEKIHPNDADKISWLLVQSENNFNIINMIADPDVLHAKVDKMDMFLKAGEAGVKPETLKMFFGTKKKRNKKKRRNNN